MYENVEHVRSQKTVDGSDGCWERDGNTQQCHGRQTNKLTNTAVAVLPVYCKRLTLHRIERYFFWLDE